MQQLIQSPIRGLSLTEMHMTINHNDDGLVKGQIMIPKLVHPTMFKDLDCQFADEDLSSCTGTERFRNEPIRVMMAVSDQDQDF